MARPKATPVQCRCPMCGSVVELPPAKAIRFRTCRSACRSEMAGARAIWADALQRLMHPYAGKKHGCISGDWFDIESDPVGDPLDRARFAEVDGVRYLFVRSTEGGWLRWQEKPDGDRTLFGGDDYERVADAPPCQVRAEQMRRLVEYYSEAVA